MRSQNRPGHQREPNAIELIKAAICMQVRYRRRHNQSTETIRASVRTAINHALEVDEKFIPAEPADGGFDIAVASFQMFRVILDYHNVDRSDQFAQESWHQMVMRELDATLGQEVEPRA
jgi:hypothetical protein